MSDFLSLRGGISTGKTFNLKYKSSLNSLFLMACPIFLLDVASIRTSALTGFDFLLYKIHFLEGREEA